MAHGLAHLRLVSKLFAEQLIDDLEESHVGLGKEIVALGRERVVHTLRVAEQAKVDERQQVRPAHSQASRTRML
jgi:hypothetical protein